MALKDNLKNLNIILQSMQEDHLSRSDFNEAIKSIVEVVKKTRSQLESGALRSQSELSDNIQQALSELENVREELAGDNQKTRDFSSSDKRTVMRYIDQKLEELYIPSEYEDAELREAIKSVQDAIPDMPDMPKIPDAFDATEILENLEKAVEDIEQLKKRPTGTVGGVTNLRIQQAFKYILKTEAPSGDIDGANTTYTVTQPIFAILAFSLNGEVIPQIPNYTINGNTIEFSTALPAAYSGKDFEVKFV